jgi:hypothetical protein
MGTYSSKAHSSGYDSGPSETKIPNTNTSQTKTQAPPPSYDETTNAMATPPTICASDTPKWRWTRSQCREWIYAVLTEYCERDKFSAQQRASKFEGFGANLYMTTWEEWYEMLGLAEARAVYALIVETGFTEIPANMNLEPIYGEGWKRSKKPDTQ